MRTPLFKIFAFVLLLAGVPSSFVFAQSPSPDPTMQSLRRDMDELIKGQIELQKQVQELKTLIKGNQAAAAPAPPPVNFVLDIAGAANKGQPNAAVTMIEVSDFQCPFCGAYGRETFPRLEKDYVETGKVRYVFRDFPLESMHPLARKLAIAGQCALEQKKFWELHHQLFSNQAALTLPDAITEQAKQAGIDITRFQKCLTDNKVNEKISQELKSASAVGVSGTPAFLIGRTDPAGSDKVKVLKMIVGHQPYENFKQAIDSLLGDKQIATH